MIKKLAKIIVYDTRFDINKKVKVEKILDKSKILSGNRVYFTETGIRNIQIASEDITKAEEIIQKYFNIIGIYEDDTSLKLEEKEEKLYQAFELTNDFGETTAFGTRAFETDIKIGDRREVKK